ncbi:unnamed protein product [Haemonchus placei]|uniref:Pept_C1 domain-containing protein n=1 Tax=Haemonchus placei TaxID=6290 RepID=A0A158QQB7_HAEPC|nr:unnamed protein product [Haemonchus placei]
MNHFLTAFCIYLCWETAKSKAEIFGDPKTDEIPLEAQKLSGEPLIKYLKENQNLFEVGPARHDYKLRLMDIGFMDKNRKPVVENEEPDDDIPESFDGREVWANCSSLSYIRDQSNCGSCWAVATASAISDRICILTKGAMQVTISATDILSCCEYCGFGCRGGFTIEAWNYFTEEGVVSGGNYGTKGCCQPYPLPPCGHHENETFYYECNKEAATPECQKRCHPGYRKLYRMDKFYGKGAYELPNSEKAIQREIMKHGPVVGMFRVFSDFYNYESGVYKHTAGSQEGEHAVKIIGWGKERETPYWLIANSWHHDWGEKGFFKMLRGSNHCRIEELVVAGLVDDDVTRSL